MPKWLPLDDEVLCDLAEVYPKHSWEDLARKFNRSFKTSAPPRTPSSLYSRHRKLRPADTDRPSPPPEDSGLEEDEVEDDRISSSQRQSDRIKLDKRPRRVILESSGTESDMDILDAPPFTPAKEDKPDLVAPSSSLFPLPPPRLSLSRFKRPRVMSSPSSAAAATPSSPRPAPRAPAALPAATAGLTAAEKLEYAKRLVEEEQKIVEGKEEVVRGREKVVKRIEDVLALSRGARGRVR